MINKEKVLKLYSIIRQATRCFVDFLGILTALMIIIAKFTSISDINATRSFIILLSTFIITYLYEYCTDVKIK